MLLRIVAFMLLQWTQWTFKTISPQFLLINIDNVKYHYVLVFDLTSMQDATENCLYPELIGEPLRLELNLTFPLEHDIELIALGERMISVAVHRFGIVGQNHLRCIIFPSSKKSTVSHYSSIGTSVLFLLTIFQLLTMTLLPLYIRNPAISCASIG